MDTRTEKNTKDTTKDVKKAPFLAQLPEWNVWYSSFCKPLYHVHVVSMKPLSVFNEILGHFQPCLQWQNQDALLSRTTRWVKKASRSKWPLYPVFVRRRPLAALSAITAVAVSRVHLGRWMVLTKRGLLFRRVLFDSIWEHHRRCAESDAKEFIVFSRIATPLNPRRSRDQTELGFGFTPPFFSTLYRFSLRNFWWNFLLFVGCSNIFFLLNVRWQTRK